MPRPVTANITELLLAWSSGDDRALDRLTPVVYDELRRIARSQLRRERGPQTLQTTALVHEAYLRLVNQNRVSWRDRLHFFGAAAGAMRRILVDQARERLASKRGGGGGVYLSLEEVLEVPERPDRRVDLLTPEYASPEQALYESVTTATDLYSLGAVLYEILTGTRARRFQTGTLEEIRRVICEEEPRAPSEASGNRELRGDLDNVIRKAMHRDPLRRYASAEEMSRDLALFLSGRPVRASKDTLRYRSGKFILRHRGAVTATALIVLSLMGGILATAWQARIAARERAKPERRFALFPSIRCCMGMASAAPGGPAGPPGVSGALLFSGVNGSASSFLGDTWMLQEGGWLQLNPANAPSPRGGVGLAYDAATGTFVLFGGQLTTSTNRSDPNDTWIWDGKTWTQVFPPISPPARRFDNQGMAYDPRSATVILFGGITGSNTVLGDTWTWNGKTKTWTSHPVTGPSPRRAPLVYADATGGVILFGGDDAKKAFRDTWEWTGSSWLERFPPTSPPSRGMSSMAYDAAIHRVVLFGGVDVSHSAGCPYNDVWTWNGVTWKEHFPTNAPSGRWAAGMVYDPIAQSEVIFGGIWLRKHSG